MRHWKRWTAAAVAFAAATLGALAIASAPGTATPPGAVLPPDTHAGPVIGFACPDDLYIDTVASHSGLNPGRTPEKIVDDFVAGSMPALRGVNMASARSHAYTLEKPHRQAWTVKDKGRIVATLYMIDNGQGLDLDRATRCAL